MRQRAITFHEPCTNLASAMGCGIELMPPEVGRANKSGSFMAVVASTHSAPRGWPLRAHLAAYASALVVPILLFNAFVIHTNTASERARNEERALEVARAIAADLDRLIGAHIITLQALASLPSLDNGEFAGFHAQASRTLAGSGVHALLRDL